MSSGWRRSCEHLAINYSNVWIPDRETTQRPPEVRPGGCGPNMRVWRHSALRPSPTEPPLQQIAPDCSVELELDSSTNTRTSNKTETDFTKNGKPAEGSSKPSYKMLIQKLAELSTLGESGDLRKIYKSTPEAEQVWKKNTVNQQMEVTAASTGSSSSIVQTCGPQQQQQQQRDVRFHSGPRTSATNNGRRWPGIEGRRGEGEAFPCRPEPSTMRRECRRLYLPLWILKPANNNHNLQPQHDDNAGSQAAPRRSYTGLVHHGPAEMEMAAAEMEMVGGPRAEQDGGGGGYPYPDFLPPPFNRVDFSELSLLEEHQWREALPARPNSPLAQLIGRIVRMEKIQLLTVQRERGRQPEAGAARAGGGGTKAASSSSSPRRKAKRGRRCRRGEAACPQQPRPEAGPTKKAGAAKAGHHKRLYRVSSGHSGCGDPPRLHSPNDDIKRRRHRRHCANWNSYQHYKRTAANQLILALSAAQRYGPTAEPGHNKPSNNTHHKHKKKQL